MPTRALPIVVPPNFLLPYSSLPTFLVPTLLPVLLLPLLFVPLLLLPMFVRPLFLPCLWRQSVFPPSLFVPILLLCPRALLQSADVLNLSWLVVPTQSIVPRGLCARPFRAKMLPVILPVLPSLLSAIRAAKPGSRNDILSCDERHACQGNFASQVVVADDLPRRIHLNPCRSVRTSNTEGHGLLWGVPCWQLRDGTFRCRSSIRRHLQHPLAKDEASNFAGSWSSDSLGRQQIVQLPRALAPRRLQHLARSDWFAFAQHPPQAGEPEFAVSSSRPDTPLPQSLVLKCLQSTLGDDAPIWLHNQSDKSFAQMSKQHLLGLRSALFWYREYALLLAVNAI
mmetsp:Transcript_78276/g.254174  ORF Transcript_78276/g.254174 Transcript_78276/m.254174 type:complete len:339 (+) Transcript_78276:1542-2558(+)